MMLWGFPIRPKKPRLLSAIVGPRRSRCGFAVTSRFRHALPRETERNRRRAVASWRHLMASAVDLIVAAFSEAPPTAQGVSAMMHNDCT
jgi:hypothetical protein